MSLFATDARRPRIVVVAFPRIAAQLRVPERPPGRRRKGLVAAWFARCLLANPAVTLRDSSEKQKVSGVAPVTRASPGRGVPDNGDIG